MKVRVVLTLDVDPERLKERRPLAVERAGGARNAAREYVLDVVSSSNAARDGSISGVTLQEK